MRLGLRLAVASLALVLAVLAPRGAGAVVRAQSEYPFDQVWNAAVRLVRVDLGFEVMERDAEGGFVLFKYRGDSGTFNASLEIVRAAPGTKVGIVIQIPEMPRYSELWLLDRLNRKMRDEYGAPPPRPTARPATTERPASGRSGSREEPAGGGRNGSRGRGEAGSTSTERRSSRER